MLLTMPYRSYITNNTNNTSNTYTYNTNTKHFVCLRKETPVNNLDSKFEKKKKTGNCCIKELCVIICGPFFNKLTPNELATFKPGIA